MVIFETAQDWERYNALPFEAKHTYWEFVLTHRDSFPKEIREKLTPGEGWTVLNDNDVEELISSVPTKDREAIRRYTLGQLDLIYGDMLMSGVNRWLDTVTNEEMLSSILAMVQGFIRKGIISLIPQEVKNSQIVEWYETHPGNTGMYFDDAVKITPENSGLHDTRGRERLKRYLKEDRNTVLNELLLCVHREAAKSRKAQFDYKSIDKIISNYQKLRIPIEEAEYTGEFPKQDQSPVETHPVFLDKTSTNIHKLITSPNELSVVDVTTKNEAKLGKQIRSYMVAYYDLDQYGRFPVEHYGLLLNQSATAYWMNESYIVTTAQIVAHTKGIANPTPAQINRAHEMLRKQRDIVLDYDFSEELRGKPAEFMGRPVKNLKIIKQPLFNAQEIEIEAVNGKLVPGWILPSNIPPILYYHASILRQCDACPQKLIEEIALTMASTDERDLIRNYLETRILRLKRAVGRNGKNKKDPRYFRITLDDLAEKTGVTLDSRSKKSRTIEYVELALSVFEKGNWIKGFTRVTVGQSHTVHGFDVEP